MISFIIYEDDKKVVDLYIEMLHKYMGNSDNKYKIRVFHQYDNNLKEYIANNTGKNIYILDLEVPGKSGIDLAREIRKNGKYFDQIIIVTAHYELKDNAYRSKLLMVDFISKYDDFEENLISSLNTAFEYIDLESCLKFKQDGEIFQVPYRDILYIEKNKSDNYVYIITKKDSIKTKLSISSIENILQNNPKFFKTHRSCIVNVNNVTRIDMVNQVITFGKKSTPNLARNKKKNFEKKVLSICK